MDKTLMVAKWFCDNNNTVQTNSYDGNVLLNKLCYYAKAMFLSLKMDLYYLMYMVSINMMIY